MPNIENIPSAIDYDTFCNLDHLKFDNSFLLHSFLSCEPHHFDAVRFSYDNNIVIDAYFNCLWHFIVLIAKF